MTIANGQIIANNLEKVYKLDINDSWANISPIVSYDYFGSVNSMNDTVILSINNTTSSWPYDLHFIMYSPDNGNTWHDLVSPVPFARDDAFRIYCDNDKLYAYEDEIMFYTNNLGLSWTDLSLPSQYCNSINDFLIFNSTPYAAACGNGQLITLNNNSNWVLSNNGLPTNREPQDLAYCDSALFAYISVYGMYVSFDEGNSWSYASEGLDTDRSISDFVNYGRHLFVSTKNGIFVTSNYGQNWHAYNEGLTNLNTSSLKILNDTLYVGTYGNGVWKRAIESNLSISEYNNSKYDVKVYPNPATDYLLIDKNNIDYENIKIIDLLGREILSEKYYTNKINIQNIPNGTYILILSSNVGVYNAKIIINR